LLERAEEECQYHYRRGADIRSMGCRPARIRMGAPSLPRPRREILRPPVRRSRTVWTGLWISREVSPRVYRFRPNHHARPGFRSDGRWPARVDSPAPDRRVDRPDVRTHLAARDPEGPGRARRTAVRISFLGRDPDGLDA